MLTSIKTELKSNESRLRYFKEKADKEPTQINMKWVEIYAERVKKLEKQLLKAQAKAAYTN